MTRTLADLKLAIRSLRRTPGFTVVAVLTLALGIAVNTAVFSVVNGVLLSPLAYDEPDRLLSVNFTAPGAGYDLVPFSDDVYLEFQRILPSLESLGIYQDETLNLVGDSDPERIPAARITPTVLEVLRITPFAGRLFTAADAEPGAEPVAVIAHELWQGRWGSDDAILGSLVELDGQMRRVVGILPPGFAFPRQDTRIWRPYIIDSAELQPGNFSSPGIARLAAGRTIEDARADLAAAIDRLPEISPEEYRPELIEQIGLAPNVVPLMEIVVGNVRQPLLVILGTVALVLLIASANVANLFLVRAESRQREVTLRSALGAGTGDLVRFFLTESLVLALVSGTIGLLVAVAAVEAFVASAPVAIPRVDQISTDLRVLGFNFAAAALAGLLFGSVPLWRHRRRELASELRDGGRTVTSGNATLTTRNLLVVAQVALALILLVGSGLMLRSFQSLRTVDPGFRADGILAVTLAPAGADYPDSAERAEFWTRVVERMAALPGVEQIGAINHAPLGETRSGGSVSIEEFPIDEATLPPIAEKKQATPGYFETLGIPVVAGRTFSADDGARGFPAAVVSESFARHWWPDGSALGKRVRENDSDAWFEIVGIVGDVHHLGLDLPPEEVVYFPLEQGNAEVPIVPRRLTIMLRTTGNPTALTGAIRSALREVDPRLPVTESRPLARSLADAMARTSFTVTMLGIAASMALFLGAIGLYGVISYIVSQRTQEIGVRIALGAPVAGVRGMVVRRGMALAGVGIGIGLVAALALSSVLATLLYEVSATDPLTYGGVALVLALTALVASWVPARRAAAVDPVVALRGE